VVKPDADAKEVAAAARNRLREALSLAKVVVHVEPLFAYGEDADLPG
jgi:hypothetical protein